MNTHVHYYTSKLLPALPAVSLDCGPLSPDNDVLPLPSRSFGPVDLDCFPAVDFAVLPRTPPASGRWEGSPGGCTDLGEGSPGR